MVTGQEVVRLYRSLLKYGRSLKLTDQTYYRQRIHQEFRNNQQLASAEDIQFAYKKGEELLRLKRIKSPLCVHLQQSQSLYRHSNTNLGVHVNPSVIHLQQSRNQWSPVSLLDTAYPSLAARRRFHLDTSVTLRPDSLSGQQLRRFRPDRSRVPVLKEEDLEERFVRGSGPGGSNVNKNANCVVLKHVPTGTVVKCHESRLLDKNRRLARDKMTDKLDNLLNGESSVEAQLRAHRIVLEGKREGRDTRRREMKREWKEKRASESQDASE